MYAALAACVLVPQGSLLSQASAQTPAPAQSGAGPIGPAGASVSPAAPSSLTVVPKPRAGRADAAPPGPRPVGPPIREGFAGGMGRHAGTFSFDFHGSDIDNVLKFFSMMSGLTVTPDPSLTGKVTIINPKPVTLDEAFKILQSVLQVRGFTAQQQGTVLKIIPINTAVEQAGTVNTGHLVSAIGEIDPTGEVMTQVIPLQNVDAESLAKELLPLASKGASLVGSAATNSLIVTDTPTNIERFINLVGALDKASSTTEMRVYPLKRAEASAISDLVNNLYKTSTPGQPGGPGFRGPFQPPQLQANGQTPAGNARDVVTSVPDSRTNSVIVVGSPANQEQIAELITRLDGDESETMDTRIRKIVYASSDSVASIVNQVLSNLHGNGTSPTTGGSPFQNRVFGFFGGFGGQNNQGSQVSQSTDPFGKVVSDPRTNSVVITASADRMTKVEELIDSLDVAVSAEATTFVFPLKNVPANNVATALSYAFGTQQQSNASNYYFGYSSGNSNNPNNTRQKVNRTLGGGGTGAGGRAIQRGSVPPGPPQPPDGGDQGDVPTTTPVGVQGVMTDHGFVPNGDSTSGDTTTPAQTRQFGGFGGQGRGGAGAQSSSAQTQYGPGRNGQYSNLLQFQNSVFVTPAPNGDAVIVTTSPGNYNAIKAIIDQLDVIPRQVMIEVIVAEVNLDNHQKIGFSLTGNLFKLFNSNGITATGQAALPATGFNPGTGGAGGTAIDPTQSGLQFVLNGPTYQAILQAITNDTKAKVIATPRVFTSNNQEAQFDVTSQVPYVTGQLLVTGLTSTPETTVNFQPIGLQLDVTPSITRQGLVSMDISAESSTLLQYQTVGTGAAALTEPVFDDRYADTYATVRDGQTVVLGGMIQDSKTLIVNKIPLLGDIPIIGQFFRSRDYERTKTELMIFVTPHVIASDADARNLTAREGTPIYRDLQDMKKDDPELKFLPNNPPKGSKAIQPLNEPNTDPQTGAPQQPGPILPQQP